MEDSKRKNRRNEESSIIRTWYLDDRPLDSFETVDHFRHRAYVAVLLQTIKELSPPFTVGIFGSWGVGKTSIINDLQCSFRNDSELKGVPIVPIDVWKYEGDSLRRQFLWDVQKRLKAEKVLSKKYDILGKLYRERTTEIEMEPRFSWRRIKSLAPFLFISLIVTFFALWIFLELGMIAPLRSLVVALIVPILLLFISEFSSRVIVQQRGAEAEPRLFSTEQFERAFENMVSRAKCDKMVILIDNLDRCSHERVVETLGVVKTYLEPKGKKCIFVIPCDDTAIKQHVKSAYKVLAESEDKADPENYADEYLRKFFNTSIRIGPFIQAEIEPYIAYLLGRIRLTEGMPEDSLTSMVQLIGAAFTENPRRIKQFLNNLTAKYLLVKDREAEPNPLISPPISSNLLFLAKVTLIEAKFANEFAKFIADDNLYGEIIPTLELGKTEFEIANTILEKNPDIRQFLLATRHITVPNSKAFFHLKQSHQEMGIPNYNEFWNAVRAGNRDLVSSLFDKGDEKVKKAQVEDILSQIRTNAEKGYFDYDMSAINVACGIAKKIPQLSKPIAQGVIGTIASYVGIRKRLSLLKPEEVFSLIPDTLPRDSRPVLNEYITLYSTEPEAAGEGIDAYALQLSIAMAIVENFSGFSQPQLRRIKEATLALRNPSANLLLAISSTNEARSALVTEALLSKSIQEIKAEEVSSFAQSEESRAKHFPLIEFILRCQDLADSDVGELWTKKCVELLELVTKEDNPHLEEYTNRCIGDSESLWSKGSSESVDQLTQLLRERYPQASPDRRLDIALTLSSMYKSCSDSGQNETKNIILNQFIQSEPPEYVSRFLVIQADKNYENLPYPQEAFDNLAQRVVSEGNEETRRQILTSFLNVNGSKRTDILIVLFVALMRRPEVQITAPLVSNLSTEFPKGPQSKTLVAPLLEQILQRSREQLPPSDKQILLNLAFHLKEWHTRQLQKKLDNVLTEFLTSTDVSLRGVGLEILTQARNEGAITEERHRYILKQVAKWLGEQQPQPDEQIMNELAMIVEVREDILTASLQSDVIEYFRSLVAPKTQADFRLRALEYLAQFSKISSEVLEGLVPELVGYAENEGDANIRNRIEECLLSLRTHNMPLVRDLWDDLRHYIRALMTNPDAERQNRGHELNKKMRRVTRNAKK